MTIQSWRLVRRASVLLLAGLLALPTVTQAANHIAAWGLGDQGQLGNAQTGSTAVPIIPSAGAIGSATITAVSQGAFSLHSCAIADGRAYCWGRNNFGQLGDGSFSNRTVPVLVQALTQVTQIAVGQNNSCAVNAGRAYCWGYGGDLVNGDGGTATRSTPHPVHDSSGPLQGKTVVQVAVGQLSACARTSEGRVACWGLNGQGQLASGNFNHSPTPVAAVGPMSGQTVTGIDAGPLGLCATTSAGTGYCWGHVAPGQGSGIGTYPTPVQVNSGAGSAINGAAITHISTGFIHACAAAGGRAYCWGANNFGQLGTGGGGDQFQPVAVRANSGDALHGRTVTRVDASFETYNGLSNSCALADGRAYCWGSNAYGQGGAGGFGGSSSLPVAVATGSGALIGAEVKSLDIQGGHVLALAFRPVLSAVSTSAVTASSATLHATADAAVTGHYLVVSQGSVAPTAAQVKAGGFGYGGTVRASGSGAMSAGVATGFAISGLSAGTAYTAYVLAVTDLAESTLSSTSFTTVANVTGACGTAQGVATSAAPGTGLCAAGTATAVGGSGGAWRWDCTGSGTGTTASCAAPYQSQSIGNFTANPASLLVGESSSVSATASSGLAVQFASSTAETCDVAGSTVSATAAGSCMVTASQPGTGDSGSSRFLAAPPQSLGIAIRQNGLCGSASGVATAAMPTGNLCATGVPSPVSGSEGAWRWSCNGLNGGSSDSSCLASYASQTLDLSAVPTTVPAYSASTLTASSSAGLTPTLSSADSSVCLFSSTGGTGTAYGVAEGICNVAANQAGTGDSGSERYLAAPAVMVGVSITPACVVQPGDNVIDRRSATSGQTITGVSTKRNVIWGSAYADTINGGSKGNCIDGGPGNDRISGNNGANQLYGGLGNDTLTPGAASNFMDGGPGTDRCLKSSSRATATTEDCEAQ